MYRTRSRGSRFGSCVEVALALGLNDFLCLLPVVGRGRKLLLKRGYLLTGQLGGGLVLYLYAFLG
jgi:hypothetical protein